MRKLAVILPTYNEAANLDAIVTDISRALPSTDYEIIIADDDSPDLTWQKGEDLSRCNDRVRVLRRTTDRGLAPAVADGMAFANAELVACMDADLQHDSVILPAMIAELQAGKTIAVGSRYIRGGGTGKWNLIRKLASKAATFAAGIVTGLDIQDPMSGYFMMRRADFIKVRPRLNLRGFKILLEIASHLEQPTVAEVPYTFRGRYQGESKLTSKVIWNYLAQLTEMYPRLHPTKAKFFKSVMTGFFVVVTNLSLFIAIARGWGWWDWRASALSTLVIAVASFGWRWRTTREWRTGVSKSGMLLRSAASGVLTIALTTTFFALLVGVLAAVAPTTAGRALTLGLCQAISVLLGIGTKHLLSQRIAWPQSAHSGSLWL